MTPAPDIEGRLQALERMLTEWLAHARHGAGFWPQFEVLAAEILDDCTAAERAAVHARLRRMLREHAFELPGWHAPDVLPSRRGRNGAVRRVDDDLP